MEFGNKEMMENTILNKMYVAFSRILLDAKSPRIKKKSLEYKS